MIENRVQTRDMELNYATAQVEFNVGGALFGTVQFVGIDGTSTAAIVTLYRSNDGLYWFPLQGSGIALGPGDDMSDEFDMTGFLFLAVRVTTAEGSAQKGRITLCYSVET